MWDLSTNAKLPLNYLLAFKNVVWFTGNAYPGPITPYEEELTAFLNAHGRLFMSGQDILDQAAGTTAFVHDYLHIDWDGTEGQNDKATDSVTAVAGTLTAGLGTVGLDHSVLGAAFEDQITPIAPAIGDLHRCRWRDERPQLLGGRNVQGRLPRLPVRGVRHRREQERSHVEGAHVLRAVTPDDSLG